MVFFLLIFSIPYWIVLTLIGRKLEKMGRGDAKRKLRKGGGLGLAVAAVVAGAATIRVERNESYWWYGPPHRMNLLVAVVGLVSLLALILAPLLVYKRPS